MKKSESTDKDLLRALALMPWWVKEKERRYRRQKKLAEKVFGALVKKLKKIHNS